MIHLLVALPAEAKPLIHAFNLRRLQPDGPFPRYVAGPLSLLLSGPGREAAGGAVEFSQQLTGDEQSHWINVGIAGHARLAPGSGLLADSVTDVRSGRCWPLLPPRDIAETTVGPLRCVAQAESRFAEVAGYDMESAAIAENLAESDALSRLQILKVISDNPDNPSQRINAKLVRELIESQLPHIAALISRLQVHA
jgi:adenosylhomocysteine nucleosidase